MTGGVGTYLTCRNCAIDRATCPRREQVRAGIKGLGITALRFRCLARSPLYRPGQRVSVTWKYYPPDWEWEDVSEETWPATVVQETKKGFLIVVDDVPSDQGLPARDYIRNDSLYCNVTAGKLTPLDEPDRRTCEYCRSAENGDGTVTGCWGANGYDGLRPVESCLASAIEARRAETRSGSVHENVVPEADAQPEPSA